MSCRCWPRRCRSFAAKAPARSTTWRARFAARWNGSTTTARTIGPGIAPRPGGLNQARLQLQQAMTMRRIADREPSCVDEKRAVERAKRRVETAQRKIEAVRHWSNRARPRRRRLSPEPHAIRHLARHRSFPGGRRAEPDERVVGDLYFHEGADESPKPPQAEGSAGTGADCRQEARHALPEPAEEKEGPDREKLRSTSGAAKLELALKSLRTTLSAVEQQWTDQTHRQFQRKPFGGDRAERQEHVRRHRADGRGDRRRRAPVRFGIGVKGRPMSEPTIARRPRRLLTELMPAGGRARRRSRSRSTPTSPRKRGGGEASSRGRAAARPRTTAPGRRPSSRNSPPPATRPRRSSTPSTTRCKRNTSRSGRRSLARSPPTSKRPTGVAGRPLGSDGGRRRGPRRAEHALEGSAGRAGLPLAAARTIHQQAVDLLRRARTLGRRARDRRRSPCCWKSIRAGDSATPWSTPKPSSAILQSGNFCRACSTGFGRWACSSSFGSGGLSVGPVHLRLGRLALGGRQRRRGRDRRASGGRHVEPPRRQAAIDRGVSRPAADDARSRLGQPGRAGSGQDRLPAARRDDHRPPQGPIAEGRRGLRRRHGADRTTPPERSAAGRGDYPRRLAELAAWRDRTLRKIEDKYPPLLRQHRTSITPTESQRIRRASRHTPSRRASSDSTANGTKWPIAGGRGMEQFRASADQSDEACRESFPDWNTDDWSRWTPPAAIPPAIPFGRSQVKLADIADGVPEDERLRPRRPSSRCRSCCRFRSGRCCC